MMNALKALCLLTAAATALVVPEHSEATAAPIAIDERPGTAGRVASVQTAAPMAIDVAADSFNSDSDCHMTYCTDGVAWCFYWAGVTGYDPSRGPVPGETRTSIGECAIPTQAAA